MSRVVAPGSYHQDDGGWDRRQPFFATDLVRRHGAKAVVAIVVAAVLAFAPLSLLYWFNALRLQPLNVAPSGQRVVVKPGRHREELERDEPGDTALLQVLCEVPTFDGYRELLSDDDPVQRARPAFDNIYVRRELVYLRRAGNSELPFGLLGPPPVSVWLPAGDYEVLVVHGAPSVDTSGVTRASTYPWFSATADCTLEARQKSVCRVRLPHYDWGKPSPLQVAGQPTAADGQAGGSGDEFTPVARACEHLVPVPTPAGYLLALGEPLVEHSPDHDQCVIDPRALGAAVPREWTRDQLAAVRNWLPEDAQPARATLSQLVDRLQWREFLEGWFCYAAAAIAGLVFTRWGAIAILEPWRRRAGFGEALKQLAGIAVLAVVIWLLFSIMTDSSGCRGPVPFRLR